MEERARALDQIAALARQHGLSADDIAAAIGQPPVDEVATRGRSVLVRVLGVLGGIFVFAGVGVFIALQWNDMNSAARVVVTLGSGLTAFALAVLSYRDPRYGAATTPLLLVAAVLEPTGMLVAFDEFGTGGDWRWASLVTTGTMALQFVAAFRGMRRSTPLFLVILFGVLFWWTALDLLDADDTVVALVLGGSLLLTAVGTDRAGHRDITPVWYLTGAGGVSVRRVRRRRAHAVRDRLSGGGRRLRLSQRGAAQPHAARRLDAGDPRLHGLVHQRALRRLHRLAAGVDRVRDRDDGPERAGGSDRPRLRADKVTQETMRSGDSQELRRSGAYGGVNNHGIPSHNDLLTS